MTAFALIQTVLVFIMLAVAIWFCSRSPLWLAQFIDRNVTGDAANSFVSSAIVSSQPTFENIPNHGICAIPVCSVRFG